MAIFDPQASNSRALLLVNLALALVNLALVLDRFECDCDCDCGCSCGCGCRCSCWCTRTWVVLLVLGLLIVVVAASKPPHRSHRPHRGDCRRSSCCRSYCRSCCHGCCGGGGPLLLLLLLSSLSFSEVHCGMAPNANPQNGRGVAVVVDRAAGPGAGESAADRLVADTALVFWLLVFPVFAP